jgi:hypothetical protein
MEILTGQGNYQNMRTSQDRESLIRQRTSLYMHRIRISRELGILTGQRTKQHGDSRQRIFPDIEILTGLAGRWATHDMGILAGRQGSKGKRTSQTLEILTKRGSKRTPITGWGDGGPFRTWTIITGERTWE